MLIERLRTMCADIRRKPIALGHLIPLMQESATEIERLRAEVEALKLENTRLVLGVDSAASAEADKLRAALRESDREVEALKLQRTAADIVGRETANIVLLQVGEIGVLRADNKHLRGEFEKAWPDAERYRWLRNAAGRGAAGSIFDNFNGSAVDECIDAARAAQGERT